MTAQADDLPTIVCLCGSTRFFQAFAEANLQETLAGKIVLSVGSHCHSDKELGIAQDSEVKRMVDELHLRKIDMADEVLVLNVDGYIGSSTRKELCYAIGEGKHVRFLEREAGLAALRAILAGVQQMVEGPTNDSGPQGVRTGLDIVKSDGHGYDVVHEDKGAVGWAETREEAEEFRREQPDDIT